MITSHFFKSNCLQTQTDNRIATTKQRRAAGAADLLGLSWHRDHLWGFTSKGKISTEREWKKPCWWQGSEVRIGRLLGVFLARGTHITPGDNQDLQDGISEGTTPPTSKHREHFYAYWTLYCVRHPRCKTTVFYYALTLCINTKNQHVNYLNCLQQWPFE